MDPQARAPLRRCVRRLGGIVRMAVLLAGVGALGGAVYGALCGLLLWPITGTAGAVLVVAFAGARAGAIAGGLTGAFGTLVGGDPDDGVPQPVGDQRPKHAEQVRGYRRVGSVRVWEAPPEPPDLFPAGGMPPGGAGE